MRNEVVSAVLLLAMRQDTSRKPHAARAWGCGLDAHGARQVGGPDGYSDY